MHTTISPAIHYWGSIVVLITTQNEDGTSNIAPISSAWFLDNHCMVGLSTKSKTALNILLTKQCVLNLPSSSMGPQINAIALTTGRFPVPEYKATMGYSHVKDKFSLAGLTPVESEIVKPVCIGECPVQLECELVGVHEMMKGFQGLEGGAVALEVKILRTHVDVELRLEGFENRIDSEKWKPMVMSFQHLYGLADERAVDSKLAKVDEEAYRGTEL